MSVGGTLAFSYKLMFGTTYAKKKKNWCLYMYAVIVVVVVGQAGSTNYYFRWKKTIMALFFNYVFKKTIKFTRRQNNSGQCYDDDVIVRNATTSNVDYWWCRALTDYPATVFAGVVSAWSVETFSPVAIITSNGSLSLSSHRQVGVGRT